MRTCDLHDCDRKHWGRGLCQTHYTRWIRTGSTDADRPVQRYQPQRMYCSVESCDKRSKAQGLCSSHYSRLFVHGDVDPKRALAPSARFGCEVSECEREHYALGYCRLHWRRIRDTGTADAAEPYVPPRCSVPGCGRRARGRGWCNTHYMRWKLTGSARSETPISRRGGTCEVSGCERPHYSRRFCHRHYMKFVHVPRRRSLERNAQGTASPDQVEARLAYFGYRCWICRGPYEQIDHVKPLSKGGPNWASNLRPTCKSCNCRKHNRWYGVARLQEVA